MKKLLLLSVCLLSAKFAFAQNYLPMAVENAHWIMYAIGENGADHYVISIKGDTTINGQLYKKTWRHLIVNNAISPATFHPPFFIEPGNLIGAMRDDTIGKQVFYVPLKQLSSYNDSCGIFEEWMIYDFSLYVGDTIGGCLQFYPDYPRVVDSISSENLFGQDRNTIACEDCSARLVEGIGTDMGPFWPIYAFIHPAKPSFLYDYCGLEDGYCGLQLVDATHQRLADWQIELSPNPAADLLAVKLPTGQLSDFNLGIFDFSGKKVLEKSVQAGQVSVQIPVKALPTGMYFLAVQQDGAVTTHRFAKL